MSDTDLDRRGFLSLAAVAALAGCTDAVPTDAFPNNGPPPTETPAVPLFETHPETLVLEQDELPAGPTWAQSPTRRREDSYDVGYEAFVDGERAYQVSLSLSRRVDASGAVFDHDRLVELYREEFDATVTDLPYGDVASLTTFGDEAHAVVAYRNVGVNVGIYDGGPIDQLRAVTERQVEKLERLAP